MFNSAWIDNPWDLALGVALASPLALFSAGTGANRARANARSLADCRVLIIPRFGHGRTTRSELSAFFAGNRKLWGGRLKY